MATAGVILGVVMSTISPGLAHADRVVNGIAIYGSIETEYQQLIDIGRSAGNPVDIEKGDRAGGRYQDFQSNNHIYWNSRVDQNRGRQIGGAIFDKWGNYDWEVGDLGYPIERETDVTRNGKLNRFEGGVVYWSPSTGAHPVWGQVLETWAASGYEQSAYGFPVADEENYGDGKRQLFENGQYIEWHPEGFAEDWAGNEEYNAISETQCGTCGDDGRLAETDTLHVYSTLFNRGAPQEDQWSEEEREQDLAPCAEALAAASQDPDAVIMCDTIVDPAAMPEPANTPSETTTPTTTLAPQESTTAPTSVTESSDSSTTTTPTTTTNTPAAEPTTEQATTTTKTTTTTTTTTTSPETESGTDFFAPKRTVAPAKPQCDQLGGNTWGGTRMYSCIETTHLTEIFQTTSPPKILGTVTWAETRSVNANWKQTDYSEDYLIRIISTTGKGSGAKFAGTRSCRASTVCTQTGTRTFSNKPATSGSTIIAGTTGNAFTPGGGTATSDAKWTISISHPEAIAPSSVSNGYTPPLRCDAAAFMRGYRGCAFTGVKGFLDYSRLPNLGTFNNHVNLAQDSGLTSELHRITDPVLIGDNRKATCGKVTGPRTAGRSCDEYPFASTDEGGRNGGYPRTFATVCEYKDTGLNTLAVPVTETHNGGFSVCSINSGENSRAGSYLSWFYVKNRILVNDAFVVNAN